jgi:hypothetical protein
MKKFFAIVALAAAISVQASAQTTLGSLLGGSTISDFLASLTGGDVVYSAPTSLNGTYSYAGCAVSITQTNGTMINNLAGSAVASTIESKVDANLAKIGIEPGSMSINFNRDDNTFTWTVAGLPLPGTFKLGDNEETITLTFGKSMQFFTLTGYLDCSSTNATVLFPANRTVAFLKKVATRLGKSEGTLATITKLAEGYDSYKIGFKLVK